MNLIVEDLRKAVLGLLFLVAFGWMAALVLPGAPPPEQVAAASASGWTQPAAAPVVVPPAP